MGGNRFHFSLFRYVAVGDQHRNDNHYLLMVFLIQNSQNRDGAAIQVKLDELIRVSAAQNFFVGIEHLSDEEIDRLRELVETHTKNRAVKETNAGAQAAADAAN